MSHVGSAQLVLTSATHYYYYLLLLPYNYHPLELLITTSYLTTTTYYYFLLVTTTYYYYHVLRLSTTTVYCCYLLRNTIKYHRYYQPLPSLPNNCRLLYLLILKKFQVKMAPVLTLKLSAKTKHITTLSKM